MNKYLFLLLFLFPTILLAKEPAWHEIKGDFVIVKYRSDIDINFATSVVQAANEEFRRVGQWFGVSQFQDWRNDKRIKIEIYSDNQDYVNNGGGYAWAHGQALALTRSIKTFPQEVGFFDTVLPHELSHIMIRYVTGFNADVPTWLDEGIAMYNERAQRYGADKQIRQAILQKRVIPLANLSSRHLSSYSKQEDIDLFYAQSVSVVRFLSREFGEQKFLMLIKLLKENLSFNAALSKIYMRYQTIDQLHKAWINSLGEK